MTLKKTLLILLAILIIPTTAFCLDEMKEFKSTPIIWYNWQNISMTQAINAISLTSKPIPIHNDTGYFSVEGYLEGGGTIDVEYRASNRGQDYVRPENVGNFLSDFNGSGHASPGGSASDGRFIKSLAPIPCAFIVFYISETTFNTGISPTRWVLGHQ
ncbi:MAG: hypothetical protein GY853_13445 [PVC group bacterium]|nr:hypothetical protein [PVC group bacterium]